MRINPHRDFGTRECPACACEVPANSNRCPICTYAFPVQPRRRAIAVRITAAVMLLAMLWWLLG